MIKDRQSLMKQQGGDLGAIKAYLDDKGDLAKATAAAADLTQTMKKIPDVFPPGTEGPNPEGKWAPKPEVWSDSKGFLAARDVAAEKVTVLVTAVKGGLEIPAESGGDAILIANAAVIVSLDDGK